MREKILFDKDWLFHDGDIITPVHKDKGPVYKQAKTERKLSGPASFLYRAKADSFLRMARVHGKRQAGFRIPVRPFLP